MTPHINAQYGDYSDIVIMPGDPKRAEYIAKTFLNDVRVVNTVRHNLGYTGFYKHTKISVQASGMGQPSAGIYATELYRDYGVQKIVRVGTCGSLREDIMVGDIVVALSSATDSNFSDVVPRFKLSPCCSYYMLQSFMKKDSNVLTHVGQITSNDSFYQESSTWFHDLAKYGVIAVDMETHALYFIASKFNREALTVNLVSDSLVSGEKEMSSEERSTKVDDITLRVLESLI